MGTSHRTRTHRPGPPAAGRSGLPPRQYLRGRAAGWSSEGDLCDQPEGRAMSGTSIATNPYLEKLKTQDLSQPTKLPEPGFVSFVGCPKCHVFKSSALPKLGALGNILMVLERRCPDHVESDRCQQTLEGGRRFLPQWGEQVAALGWRARDLLGLHPVPDKPAPNYRRLSRYDETGLIWLLQGRSVVALTANPAAIKTPTGAVTVYRRHNKPALGPAIPWTTSDDEFRRRSPPIACHGTRAFHIPAAGRDQGSQSRHRGRCAYRPD